MTLHYRSTHDLSRDVASWAAAIDPSVDLIVGIPRSGMLAASLLALAMNRPLVDLNTFLRAERGWSGFRLSGSSKTPSHVLIIDDSVNTGRELRRVRQAISSQKKSSMPAPRLSFGAAYVTRKSAAFVDTFGSVVPQPRVFQWNILHHEILEKSCMDIDGVLSPDPSASTNDDGARYRKFLQTAPLRYRPTHKVAYLVTSRLEKYRMLTETWLDSNEIKYGTLIMLDLPDAATRSASRAHSPHKAAAYLETDAQLFIESSHGEGLLIHELTDKPVFVTDTQEYFTSQHDHEADGTLSRRLRAKVSRLTSA